MRITETRNIQKGDLFVMRIDKFEGVLECIEPINSDFNMSYIYKETGRKSKLNCLKNKYVYKLS